ncbi:hypothetical protein [Mesonia sp. K4-1]|jgi:ParB family chromosome partitioning protein|uniref:ParB N-terminal domain-containing protein n=1 Tax=Mesonia sp. K4-1 TaxID=2602760 RepID=UPI002107D3ED|nr:hypothetical protein [Mesonia sp. K4-1]
MTTKASTTRKSGKKNASAKKEVKEKLRQQAIELKIQNLPIGKIIPDSMQPRKTFDDSHLKQLSESIEKYGVLHANNCMQIWKRVHHRNARMSLSSK